MRKIWELIQELEDEIVLQNTIYSTSIRTKTLKAVIAELKRKPSK